MPIGRSGDRWAALSCHYLSVAKFAPIDIKVETRKQGRSATSQRVEVSQEGRAVLDAMVWSVADVEGLKHNETTPPTSPDRKAAQLRRAGPG